MLLAGCSSSKSPSTGGAADGLDTTSSSTTTSTMPPGTGSTLATIPSGTATVDVASTDLGQVLVDLSGHTLYVFTADAAGAPTCVDDSCTKVWPPLTGSAIAVGVRRADDRRRVQAGAPTGRHQPASVHGRPLYTYSGDATPGETKGQGIGGTWFVVGADGQPIQS